MRENRHRQVTEMPLLCLHGKVGPQTTVYIAVTATLEVPVQEQNRLISRFQK